jgi:hypothetical protein
LEWLPFRNGVGIGKDAARQLSFGFSEACAQASAVGIFLENPSWYGFVPDETELGSAGKQPDKG